MATKSVSEFFNRAEIDNGDGTSNLRVQGSLSIGGTRAKITTSQDLSLAPLSYTTAVGSDFILRGVLIHFSSPITETVKLYYDEGSGVNYDTLFLSDDLELNSNWTYYPDSDYYIFASTGDQFKIEITNATVPASTAYVTLLIEVI